MNPIPEDSDKVAQQTSLLCNQINDGAVETDSRKQNQQSITEQLNLIYANEDSTLDPILQKLQLLSLPFEPW